MSKIAVHGLSIQKDTMQLVKDLLEQLTANGKDVWISDKLAHFSEGTLVDYQVFDKSASFEGFQAIMSLGGDGTLLDTLTYVAKSELPIMGINLGRLGFLASIAKENIESAMASYFDGAYELEERTLIQLKSNIEAFKFDNYALNEFAVLRKESSSMIVIKSFLNGEYLNTYWADGLMVSTPTGSTGYSLSCGGPVIMPQVKDFIITPVSPHNLNVRPLIVPEKSELKFTIESRDHSYLVSLDSRSEAVEGTSELIVGKADFKARLIKVKGNSFLETLRNKLTWGLDRRN